MKKTALAQYDKAQATPVFEWPVRVYWEDTDAGGIVFYANYLKFFERARTEWLRDLGLGQQALRDATDGMFVVTDVQLKYLRSARLDDRLCVTVCTQEAGRASVTLYQQVWRWSDDVRPPALGTPGKVPASTDRTLLCDGTVRLGWVQASTLKPQRLPTGVLHALQGTSPHET